MRKRQRFVVLVKGPGYLEERVYGVYRSFKTAEGDARAVANHDRQTFVLPIEDIEDLP